MVRKQVYIEARQEAMLKRRAAELNVSEAELIRQGISLAMESGLVARRDETAWQEARAFMESLAAAGPVEGRRVWKRDDAYDRWEQHGGRSEPSDAGHVDLSDTQTCEGEPRP